jgi:hypothetical protein
MNKDVYHAIPWDTPTTPDDYRAFGAVLDAPSEFEYGGTTKEVKIS